MDKVQVTHRAVIPNAQPLALSHVRTAFEDTQKHHIQTENRNSARLSTLY